eukprot:scaffold28921_cov191-Amphora_coffeaeformis.AAC.2
MRHVKEIGIRIAFFQIHRYIVAGLFGRFLNTICVDFGFFIQVGQLGTTADDHLGCPRLPNVRQKFIQRFEGLVTAKTGIVRFGTIAEYMQHALVGQFNLVAQS